MNEMMNVWKDVPIHPIDVKVNDARYEPSKTVRSR